MKHRNVCYHICMIKHYIAGKAKCSVFIYSLLVHIMYIIVNKATFIATEIINPIIRNSKNSTINTTSLSHSKNYEVWWQHSHLLLSHFLYLTLYIIF